VNHTLLQQRGQLCSEGSCLWWRSETSVPDKLRLSVTVTSKFFPLYHFSSLFFLLFFYLPQRFYLNTFSIPHYNYKYYIPYLFIIHYHFILN
jgi:hypothetical protein